MPCAAGGMVVVLVFEGRALVRGPIAIRRPRRPASVRGVEHVAQPRLLLGDLAHAILHVRAVLAQIADLCLEGAQLALQLQARFLRLLGLLPHCLDLVAQGLELLLPAHGHCALLDLLLRRLRACMALFELPLELLDFGA